MKCTPKDKAERKCHFVYRKCNLKTTIISSVTIIIHILSHTHTHQLSERHFKISNFTFDPVHAATTSWMAQGVTITINPKDIAAIVRDTEPMRRFSCRFCMCRMFYGYWEYGKCRFISVNWQHSTLTVAAISSLSTFYHHQFHFTAQQNSVKWF